MLWDSCDAMHHEWLASCENDGGVSKNISFHKYNSSIFASLALLSSLASLEELRHERETPASKESH